MPETKKRKEKRSEQRKTYAGCEVNQGILAITGDYKPSDIGTFRQPIIS